MPPTAPTCCTTAVAVAALVAASCVDRERAPHDEAELPPQLYDTASPPAADLFLPPLEDFLTDDDAEPGEITASLDHGDVPYAEVRRRLILDPQGFALGDVTVVTFTAGANGAERFMQHWFGDATREPTEVAGVEMVRTSAQAHDALVWLGRLFVVTFGRGREVDHEWLEGLARETVAAIRERRRFRHQPPADAAPGIRQSHDQGPGDPGNGD